MITIPHSDVVGTLSGVSQASSRLSLSASPRHTEPTPRKTPPPGTIASHPLTVTASAHGPDGKQHAPQAVFS